MINQLLNIILNGAMFLSVLIVNTVPAHRGAGTNIGTDNHPGASQYTQTIGQTFTVTAPNTVLNSFSFQIHDGPINRGNNSDDTFKIAAYVMEWENQRAKNPILYQSGVKTIHLNTLDKISYQPLMFNPNNLELQAGKQYVAFLSLIGIANPTWRVITVGGFIDNSVYNGGYQVNRGSEIKTFGGLTANPWGGSFSINTQYDLAVTLKLTTGNNGSPSISDVQPGNTVVPVNQIQRTLNKIIIISGNNLEKIDRVQIVRSGKEKEQITEIKAVLGKTSKGKRLVNLSLSPQVKPGSYELLFFAGHEKIAVKSKDGKVLIIIQAGLEKINNSKFKTQKLNKI